MIYQFYIITLCDFQQPKAMYAVGDDPGQILEDEEEMMGDGGMDRMDRRREMEGEGMDEGMMHPSMHRSG